MCCRIPPAVPVNISVDSVAFCSNHHTRAHAGFLARRRRLAALSAPTPLPPTPVPTTTASPTPLPPTSSLTTFAPTPLPTPAPPLPIGADVLCRLAAVREWRDVCRWRLL
jgi:hypothetical protein